MYTATTPRLKVEDAVSVSQMFYGRHLPGAGRLLGAQPLAAAAAAAAVAVVGAA